MSTRHRLLETHMYNAAPRRRLAKPERSIPWAALIVSLCAAPLVWAAAETAIAYWNGALQ